MFICCCVFREHESSLDETIMEKLPKTTRKITTTTTTTTTTTSERLKETS